jgi:hypothetical protein
MLFRQIEPEACVYNYGTSKVKPITMRQIKNKMMDDPNAFIFSRRRNSPIVLFITNFGFFILLRILFDYIPAVIHDIVAIVFGKVPK